MVEVVQKNRRAFDHWNKAGLEIISQALEEHGLKDFQQLVQIARS
ncbi:hypothetical protein [Solemya velesiana gill symbiont]|nr:hypothetical protein [Solemya velesiana gill symbiont]